MPIQCFQQIRDRAKRQSVKKRVGVVNANDPNVLEAIECAHDLIDAVLIGEPRLIQDALDTLHISRSYRIEAVVPGENPVLRAAAMVRANEIDMLMKGRISTSELFKGIFSKEADLRCGDLMSHLVLKQIPGIPKLLGITDGALCIQPDYTDKKRILRNALDAYHRLGYQKPNVAAVCAIEQVSPKMPETMDAAQIFHDWQAGKFADCNFAGPISYDIAMSAEVAARKGYDCVWCGDFDLLLVPSVVVGNILGKCLVYTAGAEMGSTILGCRVPVIMGSRGASAADKYNSIALSVCCAEDAPTY